METHEVVHAALEWAKSNGYAQRAREDAGGEQDKIEHLKKVVDEWRKTCDAIDRCRQEVQQRELDLRKELEQAQARIQELEKEWEQAKEVHLFNTVLRKDLDAAKRRIDELTKERDGVLRHNDELANERNAARNNYQTILSENEQLRANHQGELAQYIRQNEQLREDLNAAKDARIEAEREANDLRAWRKGLVKQGTEEPKRGNIVVVRKLRDYVCLDRYPLSGDIVGWFYPEDIFEAADREE